MRRRPLEGENVLKGVEKEIKASTLEVFATIIKVGRPGKIRQEIGTHAERIAEKLRGKARK